MKHRLSLISALCVVAFSGLAATPPPEKLLPASTVVVLTVPDFAKANAAWQQSPSTRLWADAAMKPFREKLMTKLQSDVIAPLEKEFGIKCADYADLAQGQVTFALTPNGWDGDKPGWPGALLLLDARDKSATLKTNLATLKTKWVDSGKQVRVEKIRDVEFTTLLFKSDDLRKTLNKVFPDPNEALENPRPDQPSRTLEVLVGQSDSLLVLGTSAKDIEKILVNQAGAAAATLSEQSSFTPSYGSLFRDAHAYGWVNTKSILDVLSKNFSKGGEGQDRGGLRPDKLLSAIGLSGLMSAAFNLRDIGEGWTINFNLNVPEAGRRGLFKMLSFEAKDANPPPFVPADAVKFTRWRLDLQKAWATLESSLTEASPQVAGIVKLVIDNAGKDKDPNFDLRQSLLGNLGDDIITYQRIPRKQTLTDLNSPPSLVLLGSARAEQVSSAVKALASVMPQPKVKEREFLGRKVYALNLPPSQAPGGKEIDRVLHYTASGGYVALSTEVSMLEEFMRSSDSASKALRDVPGLSEAAQKVGGMGTGLFGFENNGETARHMIETLRKESGTLANLLSASPLAGRFGMGEGAGKFREWIDFSLLPPFEQISKYFYLTVWSGNVNAEGLAFKCFVPNPPQLRK